MSLFFTTRQDGVLEAWDFLYRHRAPILECKVADYPLHCLKVFLHFSSNIFRF